MGLFGRESQQDSTPPERPARPTQAAQTTSSTTIVAPGSRIDGTVAGSADIMVEGEVVGAINSTGQVTVAETGVVQAAIRARTLKVAGHVEGNLTADELIELEPGGAVVGDLLSPRILIKDGANLQGQVEMSKPPAAGKESPKAKETKEPVEDPKNQQSSGKNQKHRKK